jgi:metal-responsive CopG/Arc/MetJ family transcriptional regulator
MPAGVKHSGRTRTDRKTLTVPMRKDELADVDWAARREGLSRAEFVRQAIRVAITRVALP